MDGDLLLETPLSPGPLDPGSGEERRAGRDVELAVVVEFDDLAGREMFGGSPGELHHQHRAHGARRTRYKGAIKTHLQNLLIAMAANLRRAALWLMGERPGTTRPASLHCLAPA